MVNIVMNKINLEKTCGRNNYFTIAIYSCACFCCCSNNIFMLEDDKN